MSVTVMSISVPAKRYELFGGESMVMMGGDESIVNVLSLVSCLLAPLESFAVQFIRKSVPSRIPVFQLYVYSSRFSVVFMPNGFHVSPLSDE